MNGARAAWSLFSGRELRVPQIGMVDGGKEHKARLCPVVTCLVDVRIVEGDGLPHDPLLRLGVTNLDPIRVRVRVRVRVNNLDPRPFWNPYTDMCQQMKVDRASVWPQPRSRCHTKDTSRSRQVDVSGVLCIEASHELGSALEPFARQWDPLALF